MKSINMGIKLAFSFLILFLVPSLLLRAELLQSSTITAINTQYNTSTYAASNLRDDDPTTKWLSRSDTSDIIFQLDDAGDAFCFDTLDLVNYGINDISVKQFMILSSNISALSGDTSNTAIGWRPVIADATPSGLIDYLSWAQGGRQVSVDSEYNSTSYGAKNIHDGSEFSKWLSKRSQSNNIIEFNFDTDWNGTTGNGIPIDELEITNYGNNDISIRELQVEVTTDGTNWFKLEVPGTASGDVEYVYSQRQEGGVLGDIDSQYNTTSYGADNLQDGDQLSRWLSKRSQGNNTIEFTFDPNNNGLTGANGDGADLFNIDKFYLENYGNDDISVREFQVAVKTLTNPNWTKIRVPNATPNAAIGSAGYDFLMSHHGGELVSIDSQYNTTSYGADNLHDGDQMTRWLSKRSQSGNTLEFQFDVNEDGSKNAADYFTLDSIYIQNYGNDDISIREFQLAVKTASDNSWQKIRVPNAVIGDEDYNFALQAQGGELVAIDGEYNSTSYAAANINDGSQMTFWLSPRYQSNNTLEFQFDVNEDGSKNASDYFTMESFYLQNYGNDDRSIRDFQVEVKTQSKTDWTKLTVPGAITGEADYNFTLQAHGGALVLVDGQYNTSSWGAKNLHDGNQMSRWLSPRYQSNNTIDFQFDVDEDGTNGGAGDLFTMENFYLENYGNDDRSIRQFQVEVKTDSNASWTKLSVPETAAGDPDYNFVLTAHGGSLTLIDDEYNSTSWGAKNIHDGNQMTLWLSPRYQFANSLEFAFDTDNNGSTGDTINLDTIELINYGNDDRSIQTFEIDVQISGGAWQSVDAPEGGTVFTANMDSNGQSWAISPLTNVTATRIRTLTNHGDGNYIGARELIFSGDSVGASYTFTAAMDGNGETFELVAPVVNVTDVRLRTISNHGDTNYVGANEFKVLGPSITKTKTFVADMNSDGQIFTLDTPLVDVTDVKLITINNHGDGNYVGAKEFKILGPSVTETKTFVAAMHGDGETFVLDNDDIPVDVTDVKLITISNHGDGNYVGAKEFKVLGPSITETKTFVAAMHGDGEDFVLDYDDVPIGVTDVKFITINNHGDSNYVGAREFEVVGESITPAHTFTVPMQAEPYRIALDSDDTVTDIIGARIVTIRNHGDGSYIGAADFKLLGNAIGPSYVFEAAMDSSTQHFTFSPLTGNLMRFHTLNNHGDGSYTGAAELVLNSGVCSTLEAHYLFNEGTGQTVADTSGNNRTATLGTSASIESQDPSWLCEATGYQLDFDASNNQRATTPAFTPPSEGAIAFWMKVPSLTSATSHIAGFGDGYEIRYESDGYIYFDMNKTSTNNSIRTNTPITTTDTWIHFAATTSATNDTWAVYLNGVLDNSGNESLTAQTSAILTLGGSTVKPSGESFNGSLEDFRVYAGELTTAEIAELAATPPEECSPIDHYELAHDGNGITCQAEPVIIKACLNADCSTLATDPVTLDFKTDNILHSSPTFTGSTQVDISQATPATLTLSIANPSVAPPNPLQCDSGGGDSCELTFNNAGFRFLYGASNATTIPAQVAGSIFPESLKIQAVKDDNGVCTDIFIDGEEVNISLSQQNIDPGGTDGLPFTVAGNNIGKHPAFTEESLTFGNGSTAQLTSPRYLDAGKIQLHANYNKDGVTLIGSSNAFWVSPYELEVTTDTTPVFKAGEDFTLTVTAKNSLGGETENYSPGQMQFSLQRTSPTLAVSNDGNLTYAAATTLTSAVSPSFQNVTLTSFSEGRSEYNFAKYSEVGTINLDVQDSNYGDASRVVPGDAINIARFTPDHFKQTVVQNGSLLNSCDMGNSYAYFGQKSETDTSIGAIKYLTNPIIAITAYNKQGVVTPNYYQDSEGSANDYMKLTASDINITAPSQDESATGIDNTPLALSASISTGTLSQNNLDALDANFGDPLPYGTLHYQLSDNDHLFYQRSANTLVTPFTADINFSPANTTQDSDNIALATTETISPVGLEIRFARMLLQNSFGPETSKLPQPLQIEHYDGNRFIVTDNTCAGYNDDNISLTNTGGLNPTATEVLGGTGIFNVGKTNDIFLVAPGAGTQGALDVTYDTYDWFKYDWDDNGTHDNNPSATATFGLFRGNDRIIYTREIFN